MLRAARGVEVGTLSERADLTSAGVSKIEHDRSGGRDSTLDAIAAALKVSRLALDDDAECFRELARIFGVTLPNAPPTLEGDLARIWAAVPPDQRAGLASVIRGLVQMTAPPKPRGPGGT